MGEGSGGGERIAPIPPSYPSPTRGEGTLPPLVSPPGGREITPLAARLSASPGAYAHKGGRIDRLRDLLSKLGYGVKTSLRDEAEPPGVGPPETT
jgi:hypothetical protein